MATMSGGAAPAPASGEGVADARIHLTVLLKSVEYWSGSWMTFAGLARVVKCCRACVVRESRSPMMASRLSWIL